MYQLLACTLFISTPSPRLQTKSKMRRKKKPEIHEERVERGAQLAPLGPSGREPACPPPLTPPPAPHAVPLCTEVMRAALRSSARILCGKSAASRGTRVSLSRFPPCAGPPADSAAMGRMHSKGKGISKSALPYRRSTPSWFKQNPAEARHCSTGRSPLGTRSDRRSWLAGERARVQAREEGLDTVADWRDPAGLARDSTGARSPGGE